MSEGEIDHRETISVLDNAIRFIEKQDTLINEMNAMFSRNLTEAYEKVLTSQGRAIELEAENRRLVQRVTFLEAVLLKTK